MIGNRAFLRIFNIILSEIAGKLWQNVHSLGSKNGFLGMSVVVRRNIFFLALGLFLILGNISSVYAARVSDLYRQDVLVNNQSEGERTSAMERALTDVLVRVTGQRDVLGLSSVRAAMKKPAVYVQSYSYRTITEDRQRKLHLQVSFDPTMVNRLLRESNVAIWGSSRPTTIMWLALEEDGRRSLLGAAADLPLVMEDHFENRGLPAIQPLLDFEDSLNISAVDVWGLFTDRLEKASTRYSSEAILAGRLRKNGDRYSGRLNMLFRGRSYQVEVDDLVAAGVSSMAADLVGGALARHYAVISSEDSEKPLMQVENINGVEDYAAVTRYLKGLTAVRDVSVYKVAGAGMTLELSIDGTVAQLVDALALGRNLNKTREPDVDDQLRQNLFYRWSQR